SVAAKAQSEGRMKTWIRPALAMVLVGLFSSSGRAHFNMLLPERASAKKGEKVTFTYQFGHPFEHQLFDAPQPAEVYVLAPDGKKTDLGKTLEKVKLRGADNKDVAAYRFRFTPDQRGDFTLVLKTPPIWMEEEKEFLQDTVQVVLHVQAQKDWDQKIGQEYALVPLTRPYGLQAGMVFQARFLRDTRDPMKLPEKLGGVSKALVEVERHNPAPPRKLPPDEHITRTAKTDLNGIVTCTLTEPGWWGVTAWVKKAGMGEHNGKQYPLRKRVTLWIWV